MTTEPLPVVVPVAVIGARGRLGSFACRLLRASPAFALVGEFDSTSDWGADLARSGAVVALEATRAGLGSEHAQRLLRAGVRPVIATSGVDLEQGAALDREARELGLGGLIVPNLSLGIVLLERACRDLAPHLPRVALREEHHPGKVDAPSGTALELRRALAEARDEAPEALAIESLRTEGRYAHHEVVLSGPGESLTLRHDMHGPEAFAPGLERALLYARTALGIQRGLAHALS